jgi:hypothetical protein
VSELFAFEIDAEVYRMQRRPNHRQVVVNDNYQGVRLLDPRTGAEGPRLAFPFDGVIDGWSLRADGDVMISFNDEERCAAEADLLRGTSRIVAHPPWRSTVGMPYDWRGDHLWMKDPESHSFASLDDERGIEDDDGMRALQTNRAWRRATDRMRRLDATCRCVEPELGRALISSFDGTDSRIGIISWVDEAEPLVAVPGRVTRVGAAGNVLAALFDSDCLLIDHDGARVGRIEAPSGFHHVDVTTLPATSSEPAILIIASAALDGRDGTRTRISAHKL